MKQWIYSILGSPSSETKLHSSITSPSCIDSTDNKKPRLDVTPKRPNFLIESPRPPISEIRRKATPRTGPKSSKIAKSGIQSSFSSPREFINQSSPSSELKLIGKRRVSEDGQLSPIRIPPIPPHKKKHASGESGSMPSKLQNATRSPLKIHLLP